jgi:peptidyl-prolyl cis-trans isomerase SurA
MKHFFLLLVTSFAITAACSQTLFTYGSDAVSKNEFLRAFNKNKTTAENKEKALQEYLDLYAKFKLKVKAAAALRLDTLEQIKYDVQNFRSQVDEGYLNDEKEVDRLVAEVFDRSQKDIHLLHFYIPISNRMTPADTIKAHKAMEALRERLLKGKTDYDQMVDEISQELIPVKGKDLGYITALSLSYEIESLVYALQPGGVSNAYRSKGALHVFKNEGERKSAGRWKIAQILFAIPSDATAEKRKATEKLADSIYQLLQGGADFASLAKIYSDDRITYQSGGEMAEFGTGKFEQPFEKAVFVLENDGEISKPFFTGYGYHIVKRLQQKPTPTDKNDEAYWASLKQQVTQDARINIAKANFFKDVLKRTGFKRNTLLKDEQLFRYADSVAANKEVKHYPISKNTLFSFTKSTVTGNDWLHFVKDYKLNADVYKGENNKALLEKYLHTVALEYYRKHLETYNEDFRYQMQEFKEGNMLFEIMERNVWSKAANDTEGLKKFYETNKSKYKWEESATVLLFNCNSVAAAQEATDALRSGKHWKQIAEESDGRIQADSGRYELSQIQIPEGSKPTAGLIVTPQVNPTDNTASFVQVLQLFPGNQQRSFEEARGLVINDYQNHLEEKWVAELKKKYPIKVNRNVFEQILK